MRKLLIFGFLLSYMALPFVAVPGSVTAASATLASVIPHSGDVTVLVEKAKGSLSSASLVDVVSLAVKSGIPVAKKAVSTLSRAALNDLDAAIATESNSAKRGIYERVAFAARKNDVRLCNEKELFLGAGEKVGLDTGDLIAFCTAAVAGDSARCGQIHDESMKSICLSAFERQ